MSTYQDNEPSLDKIEDYNGKESKEKRNGVRLVIIFLIIFGCVLAYFLNNAYEDSKKEYVGTAEKPGIATIHTK